MKPTPKPRCSAVAAACFTLLLASIWLNHQLYTGRLLPVHQAKQLAQTQDEKDFLTTILGE